MNPTFRSVGEQNAYLCSSFVVKIYISSKQSRRENMKITVNIKVINSHGNPSKEEFRFLKLLEFKQLKSFVRIRQNFKAKMGLNNKEWHDGILRVS